MIADYSDLDKDLRALRRALEDKDDYVHMSCFHAAEANYLEARLLPWERRRVRFSWIVPREPPMTIAEMTDLGWFTGEESHGNS